MTVPVVVRPPPSWQLKMSGSFGAAARMWRANSSKSRSCIHAITVRLYEPTRELRSSGR